MGWVWSSARLIRVSQAEERKKDKEKEETRRFLFLGVRHVRGRVRVLASAPSGGHRLEMPSV